jgi:antitoxin ParD1/3/4
MPTLNVNLTDHDEKFIEVSVAEGRFADASEAVRVGLRLLERQAEDGKAKSEWLRGAIQEGVDAIDRGEYHVLNSSEDIDTLMEDIHSEVMAERAAGQ